MNVRGQHEAYTMGCHCSACEAGRKEARYMKAPWSPEESTIILETEAERAERLRVAYEAWIVEARKRGVRERRMDKIKSGVAIGLAVACVLAAVVAVNVWLR